MGREKPSVVTLLGLDAIRHTYLHFVLDPLVMKRAYMMPRLVESSRRTQSR